MNGKSHTVNVDNFIDMLKICPKLPGQKFEDPPFEEEILSFIRDLGHTGEIKYLSGKTTTLESLHLSRAKILWGMYHNKLINYVYLLWEDFVYQVENKNSKKNNDIFYIRFTKVIVDYFMAKDPSISRRNKMFWHTAKDDFKFTTIRVISKHQDTQLYGAILRQHLTNQAMLESKAYKTYRAYATGEKTLKPKSTKKKADSESSPTTKPTQASKGKRIKTSAKGDKPAKKKQSTTKSKGLTVLSKVALTKAEQMKIALERRKIQQHSSHASGSGTNEGLVSHQGNEEDDDEVGWYDNDDDNDDNEDNNDDDNDADNQDDDDQEDDGQDDEDQDDLSTQDQEVTHNEEENDEEIQGANVEEEELDEEETNDEDKANELYRDVNVNLEGRDIEMTDAQQTNVQTTQVIEETHVIITLINLEGIDSIFNLNTESTSLIDVLVTTIAEPPLLSTITLPPPPIPLITHLDEAQAENADIIYKLNDNIKKIIKDQVKEQVKAQVSKILPKIEKTINKQLEAKVLTRSSNESQTYHIVAANLSELELKKILTDKMERNKSIHRSDEQKNLYKALVNAYESDKLILDTYGDNVLFKRCRDDEDKVKEPSTGSNRGSKRRRAGKELESTSALKEKSSKTTGKSTKGSKSHHKSAGESAQAEDPRNTTKDL
ncbi:hypothetical protein Tco_1105371 [Tanacetum coccineum]